VRDDLPTGTVTFLFTDVEGSTRLLHDLGAEGYAEALAEHRRLIREACASEGGIEVDTQGDAFFFAFPTAPGAVGAASAFTETLASGPIAVRVGLHTGTPLLTDEGYVGGDVHRAARIAASGHGGQVLVSASTASLVELGLHDLGEHRFKDLAAPERVYQLGDGDFPALKSLYRTNLPVPATPFLGREAELAEVVELLTADATRLLTLTGPGGTGKTRLALQAAAEASESFPDGVFWVPLAPLRDPALVVSSIARTLAVAEEPGTALEETLTAHLSGKTLLCLLDSVEHLLPEAAERIATLRASNGSILLVTSRERLRIGGEQTWPVPPLANNEGTALFLARARAVDPAFTRSPAVDELCVRLDGLPLAIELAAARTAVFSTQQLVDRLSHRLDLLKGNRDVDPRQQTLRATIEWSHQLLSAEEQQLFARLGIFIGGCTYEAAEEVAEADPDTLQSLLDKSLVRKRETDQGLRYWMLETIREYAAERLEASGEAGELRQRHAEWFLALAEEAYPFLRGTPQETAFLDRMEVEHDNFRAVFDRAEPFGDVELALQLAGAVYRFWYLRGHAREGFERIDRLLQSDLEATPSRGRAVTGAAVMAFSNGDLKGARQWAEEGVALSRDAGDMWGATYATYLCGMSAARTGDFEQALLYVNQSLDGFRELGDEHYVLSAMDALAWVHGSLGDHERRRALHEDVLQLARDQSNERIAALQLHQLAMFASRAGDHHAAVSMLEEAYSIYRNAGLRTALADIVAELADVLANAGHVEAAARVLSCATTMHEEFGWFGGWTADETARVISVIRTELDDCAFGESWETGKKLTSDDAVALALSEAGINA
jgi:predicted ATPase/class 3 adenylate cyclase